MPDYFKIIKASGQTEAFDPKKFNRSLHKAGVPEEIAARALQEILQLQPKSTREIHDYIIHLLAKKTPALAARYNLKQALIAFGPTGFPFEQYVATLFEAMGYKTWLDQEVQGFCISHEIDVIAQKNHERYMIECKFHNEQGLKSDVKVPLYIKARFDDVNKSHDQSRHATNFDQSLIVCNTKFTTEAIAYAQCVGIQLLSWDYPHGQTLPDLIAQYQLHPITALTSINNHDKKVLIDHGLVLCKDARLHKDVLKTIGIRPDKIENFITESEAVCAINQ